MKISTAHKTACIMATIAICGDKWTPLLIHALSEKPLRFCELQEKVGGINPRTLSMRLTHLEKKEIIAKIENKRKLPYAEYVLTQKGKDLFPLLQQMNIWGEKYKE